MGVFGNDFNLTNTGTVSGVYAGLQLSGSNTSVNNSGTISGTIAV